MHILLTFKVNNQRHMGNSMLNPILAICVATSPQPQKKSWSLYNWCLFCHGQESRPRCTDISIICQAEAQRRFRTLDMKRQGRGSSVAAMSLRLLCLIQFQTIFLLLVVLLHVQTLSVFGIGLATSTYFGGNETDHQALLAFKTQITRDPENVFSSWNDSLHFCEWEGVTCGRKHRVKQHHWRQNPWWSWPSIQVVNIVGEY